MSKTTKRKHVIREVLEEFITPSGNQQIVKVTAGKGSNLHEVQTSTGERFLVSMPTKFRRNVWIKRGDFVVVEPIEEGDKVKAEITHILYKYQIRHLKQENLWPVEFEETSTDLLFDGQTTKPFNTNGDSVEEKEEDEDEESDTDLFVNTNRPQVTYDESESDSSSEVDY